MEIRCAFVHLIQIMQKEVTTCCVEILNLVILVCKFQILFFSHDWQVLEMVAFQNCQNNWLHCFYIFCNPIWSTHIWWFKIINKNCLLMIMWIWSISWENVVYWYFQILLGQNCLMVCFYKAEASRYGSSVSFFCFVFCFYLLQ